MHKNIVIGIIMFLHKGINVLGLFDGKSSGKTACDLAGIGVNKYYSAEINKYANIVSNSMYPDIIRLGDVTKWREWNIEWDSIDLILAGSPCQGFSFAGKQLAFDDPRSALFFVFVDILNHVKGVNSKVKFMLENVKMKTEHRDVITDKVEADSVLINSALVSGQNRQRNYWCNWRVDQPEDLFIRANTVIQHEIQTPNSLSWQEWWLINGYFQVNKRYSSVINWSNKAVCQTTRQVSSWNGNLVYTKKGLRFVTPRECFRLQTVPEHLIDKILKSGVSNTQLYKIAGNGWTDEVIAHNLRYSGLHHANT